MERFGKRVIAWFSEGLNLNTTYAQLSDLNKGRVLVTMDSMQVDTSGLTAQSTIRDALQTFGISIASRPISFFGLDLEG